MLRKALLTTIVTLAVAIPLTAVWGQSTRRQPAPQPTLGERLSNFGREIFGPPDGAGMIGDPFAPPSEARRAPTPARRPPERVAANPNIVRREPAPTVNRQLPRPASPPPFDTNTSNRRRRAGAEGILAPESREEATTVAIPRRESRSNFTPAMPREEAPATVTKRRRTYQPPEQSQYAQELQPQTRYQDALEEPATAGPPTKRQSVGRGYAPHLARGHAPLLAQQPSLSGEAIPEAMPTPAYRTGEPTLAREMQSGRTQPNNDEGNGPRIVRNRHVEEPRAGSVVGARPSMVEEPTPRMARAQQPGGSERSPHEFAGQEPDTAEMVETEVVESGSHRRIPSRDVPSVVAESATPPDYALSAEQETAAESDEADMVADEQSYVAESNVAEEPQEEMAPDAIATDIGAEGRSLTERLSAARSFSAPKQVLRDPATKNPAPASNLVAPAAPNPDAAEIVADVPHAAEVPAVATSEVEASATTPVEESTPLVGIPRKITRPQPTETLSPAQPTPAAVVETANNVEAPSAEAGAPDNGVLAETPATPTATEPTQSVPTPAPTLARAEVPSSAPAAPQTSPGDSVLLTKQSPVLAVETIGPRNIKVGLPARYRVVVENSGQVAAEGVAVNVDLPEWADVVGANASTGTARTLDDAARGVEWRVGRVEPGSRQQLALEITARRSEPLALDVRWNLAPVASQTRVVVEEPKLEMRLNGPEEVNYGELERFALEISNPGNGDAEQVVVRLMPANPDEEATEQAIGTIVAGETKTVDLELSAHKSGTFWIKAEADGQGGLHSSVASEVLVRRAALAVAMEGPPFQYAGTEATYRVRLTNTGNAAARNVELRALMPAGAEHVESTETSRVELAGGRVVWGLANLAAGEEREFEFSCKLVEPGTLRPQVVCTAEDDLTASDGAETTVEALADLSLEIRDPRGPVPVGEEARFEVRIKNRGTSAAHDIDVAAFFAAGVEPVKATGAEHRLAEGQVVFDKIATLAAGEELVLAILAESQSSGNHAFRVELTCPELETNLAAEESTHFYDRRRGQSASAASSGKPAPAVEHTPAVSPEPAATSVEEPAPAATNGAEVPAQP